MLKEDMKLSDGRNIYMVELLPPEPVDPVYYEDYSGYREYLRPLHQNYSISVDDSGVFVVDKAIFIDGKRPYFKLKTIGYSPVYLLMACVDINGKNPAVVFAPEKEEFDE